MYARFISGTQIQLPPMVYVSDTQTVCNFPQHKQALLKYGYLPVIPAPEQKAGKSYSGIFILKEDHIQAEWTYTDTAPQQELQYQDFEAACQQFRAVCTQIGYAIDQPNFKGGFDQMTLFAQSPVYSTIQGLKLGIAWAAANEACQHEAAKLGIYRPGDATWWRMCWQQQENKVE